MIQFVLVGSPSNPYLPANDLLLERAAITALYNATGGQNWALPGFLQTIEDIEKLTAVPANLTSQQLYLLGFKTPWFAPNTSYCQWFGITCCATASEDTQYYCANGPQSVAQLNFEGQSQDERQTIRMFPLSSALFSTNTHFLRAERLGVLILGSNLFTHFRYLNPSCFTQTLGSNLRNLVYCAGLFCRRASHLGGNKLCKVMFLSFRSGA